MAEPIVGIALGSGAARGWSHIGVIEVLLEAGIKPKVVTGTSMGALVGAAYACGRLKELSEWASALRWYDVAGLVDVSLTGGGVLGGRLIENFLRELGITGDIEAQATVFSCVATDYQTGREEWLRSGDIIRAVRASISLPGVFKPVEIDGEWYVDGGLVNPVPVSTCRALGANFIIAVNLNGDIVGRRTLPSPGKKRRRGKDTAEVLERAISVLPKSWGEGASQAIADILKPKTAEPGYFDVLANSINIMQDRITRSRLAGEPPHVLLTPRLASMDIFDFDKAKMAIEEGREVARYALPEIERGIAAGHFS